MDGFELRCDGERVRVQPSVQRLIAYLALHNRPLMRVHVAGTLWLDCSEARSCANLRSTLWRVRSQAPTVVEADASHTWLSSEVHVDVRDLVARAADLERAPNDASETALTDGALLGGDLLPDWYDDWVVAQRERLRELRVHALEALAERAIRQGRYGAAIDTALTAIEADPLRETAHRALIRAYLAEGNPSAGIRHYREYCRRVQRELSMNPSAQMRGLVSGLA